MNPIVEAFAQSVPKPCGCRRCREGGCAVRLNGIPEDRAIADITKPDLPVPLPKRRPRADFILVAAEGDDVWVSVLELKEGGWEVNGVVRQLKGGAEIADKWLPDIEDGFTFLPVIAHGRAIRPRHRLRLREQPIRLRGMKVRAQTIRCGCSLARLLVR